jgi:hypothetical protein
VRINNEATPGMDAIFRHIDHDRIGSVLKLTVLRRGALTDIRLRIDHKP